jgi:hypothetical protein
MGDMERFAGVWRLVSYETQEADGATVEPFGPDAVGMLIYTKDGYMSGQVMRRGRENREAGAEGYIAYCGSYRVDEAGEVIHQVEASLYPGWVGSEQRRGYAFAGIRLTLSAKLRRKGREIVGKLVWERVQNRAENGVNPQV